MGIIASFLGWIKRVRESNIAKREAINRVKYAMRNQGADGKVVEADVEAKALAEKLKVSYADALLYVESKRKSQARKESFRNLGQSLHEIGVAAKEDNKRRAKSEGWG